MKLSTIVIDIFPALIIGGVVAWLAYDKLHEINSAVSRVEQIQTDIMHLENQGEQVTKSKEDCGWFDCIVQSLSRADGE